jgi:sterol desaturase/sphingolipid hydroxylase (fatty acid hydroxylase superfamily)
MDIVTQILHGAAAAVGLYALSFMALTCFEYAFPHPKRPQPSLASRLRGFRWWLIYSVVVSAVGVATGALWAHLHVHPLLSSFTPPGLPRWLATIVAFIAAIFAGDFFYYWCHRFQHRFLWRWHATHHAVRELSGAMAYHHPTEQLMRLALYIIPVALVLPYDGLALPIVGGVLALQGHYLHSPMRLNFGQLWVVFQDNRFHRIHHSIHPKHYDKNFGVIVPLWDVLFGTAYWPRPDEWPETGVEGMPQPEALDEYLLGPIRYNPVARRETGPAPARR